MEGPGRQFTAVGKIEICEIDAEHSIILCDHRTQQYERPVPKSQHRFRKMPRFVVEKTVSARTEWTEITASVKDCEQVTAHQDSGLDIGEAGMNIGLVAELDDIRHRRLAIRRS